jgi:hypothetical protein
MVGPRGGLAEIIRGEFAENTRLIGASQRALDTLRIRLRQCELGSLVSVNRNVAH